MSVAGFVVLVIAVWATYASVRTIRRIGLRRFSLAVSRLGWDLGKVALSGAALVSGALAASAASRTDDSKPLFDDGHDVFDHTDLSNVYLRPESPLYVGDKKEGEV
jgi:hypothetical protein